MTVALTPRRRASRRLDNFVLRWHARLDSDWSDHSLPWIIAGVAFVLLSALALARERMIENGFDLAVYAQAAWQLGHGEGSFLTSVGHSLLDLHGSFAFFPLALLSRLPISLTKLLLVAQAAALAYGVLPLWRIARRTVSLRIGATTALVAAYLLHPALHSVNLADFHPEALAIPALLAMAYRGLSGSTIRYAATTLLVLAIAAEYALLVAGFGVLLVTIGRRRLGLATASLGALWMLGALRISWLGAGDGEFLYRRAFAPYGDNAAQVIGHWLAHPFDTLTRLGAHRNLELAIYLLLPLAFLPLLGLRYLAPALPWLFLVAMADVPENVRRTYLLAGALPFLLLAAAIGLGKLGRPTLERFSVHPVVVAALVLASLVFFVDMAPSSPYAAPWSWGSRDQIDEARDEALETVDSKDVVSATQRLLVPLAERTGLHLYRQGEQPPADTDVVLVDPFDLLDLGQSPAAPPPTPTGFDKLSEDHGVYVFRRSRP
ncbi:MAG: hypothetical protein QOJ19_560 [Acidimicrobiia bacterium]|nr:hypothetical protein [Acidimicrobiia bacterium]